jgi:hypothetical protein
MTLAKTLTTSALSFAFAALLAGSASAGDGGKKAAPTKPAAAAQQKPDMAAMMKAMSKWVDPNDNHKKLAPLVGSWDVTVRMWMAGPGQPPSAQPSESKATAEKKFVLGDRFVQEDFKGDFMGRAFVGQGMTGYDNAKQKYVNTWYDNMSTGVVVSEGTMDPTAKELTMASSGFDPMVQKQKNYRVVMHIESDKKHSMEWFEKGEGGKEFKSMECIFTRKQ